MTVVLAEHIGWARFLASLILLLFLFLFRAIFRRLWLAAAAFIVVFTLGIAVQLDSPAESSLAGLPSRYMRHLRYSS